MMSLAFEVTSEDVENVLRSNPRSPEYVGVDLDAEELLGELNVDLIESEALMGDDIDEQTDYAHDEIARQLRQLGILDEVEVIQ